MCHGGLYIQGLPQGQHGTPQDGNISNNTPHGIPNTKETINTQMTWQIAQLEDNSSWRLIVRKVATILADNTASKPSEVCVRKAAPKLPYPRSLYTLSIVCAGHDGPSIWGIRIVAPGSARADVVTEIGLAERVIIRSNGSHPVAFIAPIAGMLYEMTSVLIR